MTLRLAAAIDLIGFAVIALSLTAPLDLPPEQRGVAMGLVAAIGGGLAGMIWVAFRVLRRGRPLLANLLLWPPALLVLAVAGFIGLFIVHDLFSG